MKDSPPTTATAAAWQRPVLLLMLAGLLAVGSSLAWHSTGDFDLPLHDRTGRDILDGNGFPRTNQYSFTAPDHPWVNHAWAFQVLVAVAGSAAGGDGGDLEARVPGWQVLRLLLTASLLAALLVILRRELTGRHADHRAALILLGPVALTALALLWTRLILRPELLSYLLFVLVLPRVEAALRTSDRGPAGWRALVDPRRPGGQALLLTVVWYQMHGFALLAAGLWLLGGLLGRSPGPARARWRLAGGGLLLALLAGLATPGGLAQVLYPLRVAAQFGQQGIDLQATISEMVPLLETRDSLAATLTVFKLSLVWGGLWIIGHWGRLSRLRVALYLLSILAAWQAQRNLGFYALSFLLLHGDLLETATATPWRRLRERLPRRARRLTAAGLAIAAPAITLVLIGAWIGALLSDRFYLSEGVARRWGGGLTPANYPLEQAALLSPRSPLRVANNVNAASTLIAAGAGPLAIDGRTEAYPSAAWRDYHDLLAGRNRSRQRLSAWRAEAVCLAHRTPATQPLLRTLLDDEDWVLASADAAGVLFLPGDAAPSPAGRPVLHEAASRFRRQLAAAATDRDVRLVDEGVALAALLQTAEQTLLAEDILAACLPLCPDHPALHHNLGNLLLARGDYRGALERFETAARLNRNSAPPLVNAGECLVRLGRPREAAQTLARAVARDPRSFPGWANLAEARRQLGDRRGAAEAYQRALELRPDDQRLRARARSL